MITLKNIVPKNIKGKSVDLDYSVTVNNKEETAILFKSACERVLNVFIWHKLCDIPAAIVKLTGPDGEEIYRPAQVNDYFKIDIAGPGPAAGDGYDWVKVEAIEYENNDLLNEEIFGMKVRSSVNPKKSEKGIAHFFTNDATSSFVIKRVGNIITALYYGRNEIPNVTAEKVIDKIRNTTLATFAMLGFSEMQWKMLIKGFLNSDNINANTSH